MQANQVAPGSKQSSSCKIAKTQNSRRLNCKIQLTRKNSGLLSNNLSCQLQNPPKYPAVSCKISCKLKFSAVSSQLFQAFKQCPFVSIATRSLALVKTQGLLVGSLVVVANWLDAAFHKRGPRGIFAQQS
jgi:hypothetical protein